MIPDHAALPEKDVERLLKNDRIERLYRRMERIHGDMEFDTKLAMARQEPQTDEELVESFRKALENNPK